MRDALPLLMPSVFGLAVLPDLGCFLLRVGYSLRRRAVFMVFCLVDEGAVAGEDVLPPITTTTSKEQSLRVLEGDQRPREGFKRGAVSDKSPVAAGSHITSA